MHRSPFLTVKADGSDMRVMWAPYGAQAAWSPDDSRIAVLVPDRPTGIRLFTMAADGSDKRTLVPRDATTNNGGEGAARGEPTLGGRLEWSEVEQ